MEVKVSGIYSVPSLRFTGRVHEVNGETVKFTNGIEVNIADVKPAITAGSIIMAGGFERKVKETIKSVFFDETVRTEDGEVAFLNSRGVPMINIVSYNENDESDKPVEEIDKLHKMVLDFFETTSYKTTPLAINKIIATWNENKEHLRSILSKHPAWNEEEMALDWSIEVPNNESRNNARNIYDDIIDNYKHSFRHDYDRLSPLLGEISFEYFFEGSPVFKKYGLHIADGMKPSRALRKFFTETLINRIDGFEKKFAELSDALSNKSLIRRVTLSIHPLDFLRMSYGNSWKSCHHIGEHGCYSNGTLSYLMDTDAMVLSLLDPKNEDKTYEQKKINRMMFFLNEDGDILQSRLYPQVRIQALEDILAKEVAQKISECLNIEQTFEAVIKDTSCDNYVITRGTHYKDYACSNFGQRIWSINAKPGTFHIGHDCYCVTCGERNDNTGSLNCGCVSLNWNIDIRFKCPITNRFFNMPQMATYNPEDHRYYLKTFTCDKCGKVFFDPYKYCKECRDNEPLICAGTGEVIEEGEQVFINGEFYSREYANENFVICIDCGEYVAKEDAVYVEHYGWVCEDCESNNDDIYFCEDCETYHHKERTDYYYIQGFGYVCQDCYDNGDYGYCYHCEDYFRYSDMTNVENDHDVCPDCLRRYYRYCDRCEEYHLEEDGTWLYDGDTWYCEYCTENHTIRCDRCGEYYPENEDTRVGGDYWCPSCVEEYAERCHDCGEYIDCDDAVYDEETQEYYCQSCYNELVEERENEAEETEDNKEESSSLATLLEPVDRFEAGTPVEICNSSGQGGEVCIKINDGVHEHYRYVDRMILRVI